jgi:hypothetical protein
LKRERREAIRPLRQMLDRTHFGIRLADPSTRLVLITLDSWSRRIAWADCGNRAVVAKLQQELIAEADGWLSRASDDVVSS